jgi:hypothetical protein
MIDSARIRRSLLAGALFSVLGATGTLLLGQAWTVAGGLLLGAALGAVPFASWSWIASRGFATRRARALAVALLAGKLGLYGGVLFLLVTRPVMNAVAVMAGITLVSFTVVAAALVPAAPKAREAA